MSRSYKITIIGAGNVAWHLTQALEDAGHSIQEVYSKDLKNAKKLCGKLYDAFPSPDLDFTESQADIFFISVSDDAIDEVKEELKVPDDAIVAHTSGTKPLDILELNFSNVGVFYPLQTFSKSRKIYFEEVPICIEASDERTDKILTEVARSITPHIYHFDSEKRKVLHISAVFACNFTNHMLALGKEILEEEDIDFSILQSLISETIHKALENDPKSVQTGPVIRKDVKTLQEHLKYLNYDPDKKQIYKLISESILKLSKK
jgi:predicted short-subunit dehydrogenase-like oxidoreductase (DUF2520 family)